jgi:uncharacterized protein Usg
MLIKESTLEIAGFGLTTANILYRLPNHPTMLQAFIWQHYDVAPLFPELQRFLEFWRREIEGPLHSVTVAHHALLTPHEVRAVAAEFAIH